MTGNVIKGAFVTHLKLNADEMIEANKGAFDTLCFFGRNKEGDFIAGSNIGEVGEILVMLELFKQQLLEGIV